MLTVLAALDSLDPVLNVLKTIFGIGGLIFVHELGHFLVGRWCGVRAEIFSIGFGPALLKWTPGATEYRLAPIPLGGYVKFLGENPDEEAEPAPDSFQSATYPRKAAILLAGVAMNVLVAFLLFVWTFSIGVDLPAPIVGTVMPGAPAWEHGILPDDEIVTLDGKEIIEFRDVVQDVALVEVVDVEIRRNGELLPVMRIETQEASGGLRRIGVGPAFDNSPSVRIVPDSVAEEAGLEDRDHVVLFDGAPVTSARAALALYDAKDSGVFTVERDGERIDVSVTSPMQDTYLIGVLHDALRIGAVRRDGVAARAGLQRGDRPVTVDGQAVTTVSEFVARITGDKRGTDGSTAASTGASTCAVERDGATVEIAIGADAAAFVASLAPDRTSGLIVSPSLDGQATGPAHAAGIKAGSQIVEADGDSIDGLPELVAAVKAAGEDARALNVRWVDQDGTEHAADIAPVTVESRADPGMRVGQRMTIVQETDVVAAVALGMRRTQRWVGRILTTLSSLFTGRVSPKNLAGPIAIAQATYSQAESGLGQFLLFLGFISMNLAVLNVLPIPMLDGGQLAMYTAERIRGRPLPSIVQEGLQWAGLILLLTLMVFVVANDLSRL